MTNHKLEEFCRHKRFNIPSAMISSRKRHFQTTTESYLILEMKKYNAVNDFNGTALDFWKQNENAFPALTKFACSIFCIPASSVPVENAYATLNSAASDLKNRFSPEKTSNVIMLKSLLSNNFVDL